MKKYLLISVLFISLHSPAQSVFGYWYGQANVKAEDAANNYLVELVLMPEKNYVKGILNYYFKDTYRSMEVKGNYDAATRQLSLYNIPVAYYRSTQSFEADCMMNLRATLRVAQAGSALQGSFISLPDYKYTCPAITFNLGMNADISKKDSVLKAISEFKENYQVWKPTAADSQIAVSIIPTKVIDYVAESEYIQRKKEVVRELEVESDKLKLDIYDNGEVDGDRISLFYNEQLILSNQTLTHRSIHVDIVLDSTKEFNEISMFAENLGRIPPNTSFLVITDGKTRYEISVASTLDKNGTIRLKRKKAPGK